MEIYFSNLDRTEVYQVPILPEDMPELSKKSINEEFETYNDGVYNILGNVGLISFSLESFLPKGGRDYPFDNVRLENPYVLINLWSGAMNTKTPVRCVQIRDDKTEIINILVSVESMDWHEDRSGDIKYKIDLKEYRQLVTKSTTTTSIANSVTTATTTTLDYLKKILNK